MSGKRRQTWIVVGGCALVAAVVGVVVGAFALIRMARYVEGLRKEARVQIYDPQRDAAADLRQAMDEAQAAEKNILLVVGGNWCSWCVRLDRFVRDTPEVNAAWTDRFVTVHVNVSDENENEAFLSRYPKIHGYPQILVLDGAGKLLHVQDTGVLEDGRGYSAQRVKAFLEAWTPNRTSPHAPS